MSSPPPHSYTHPGPAPVHPELPDGIVPAPAPAPGGERHPFAQVPIWSPLVAMFATFVVASLPFFVLVGIVEAAGTDVARDKVPPGILITGSVIQDLAFLGFAVLFARIWTGSVRPSDFGLRRTPLKRAILWAAAVYAGFWAFAAIYSILLGPGQEQDLVTDLRNEDSLLVLIGFGVLVAFVAPIVEEFFFRGFLFGVLRERIGVLGAALIAGTIFGLIHAPGTPLRTLGILVVLGIGLCVLYWKTNSLLPGIAVHALNNTISFGVTTGLSAGLFVAMLVGSLALVLAAANVVISRERRLA